MVIAKKAIFAAFPALILVSSPVFAKEPASAFLPAGEIADAPFGFVEMCARDRQLCTLGGTGSETDQPSRDTAFATKPDAVSDIAGATSQLSSEVGPCISQPATKLRPDYVYRPVFSVIYSGLLRHNGWPSSMLSSNNAAEVPICSQQLAGKAVTSPLLAEKMAIGRPVPPLPRTLKAARKRDMNLLHAINKEVNSTVIQIGDTDSVGVGEYWQRSGTDKTPVGDCEDIAIEKRIRLMERGFASDRLFYAVNYVKGYGLHTVLVARLDSGDYILDSLSPFVLKWSEVKYNWLRQQVPTKPLTWLRIGGAIRNASAAAATDQIADAIAPPVAS